MTEDIITKIAALTFRVVGKVSHPTVFVIASRLGIADAAAYELRKYVPDSVTITPVSTYDGNLRIIRGRTALAAIFVDCHLETEENRLSLERSLQTVSEMTGTPVQSMIHTYGN